MRRQREASSGAVLMEYVIVTTVVLLALVGLVNGVLFDVTGSFTGDFGFLGNAFRDWYQRLMCGVSLPIP